MSVNRNNLIFIFLSIVTIILFYLGIDLAAFASVIISFIFIFSVSSNHPLFLIWEFFLLITNFFNFAPSHLFGFLFSKIQVLYIILVYLIWLRKKNKVTIHSNYYVAFVIPMIIISAIMAYIKCGQSIFNGLLIQTEFIVVIAFYPLLRIFQSKYNNSEVLMNTFLKFSFIYVLILCCQYFLGSNMQLLQINYDYTRLGSFRISEGYLFAVISIFILANKALKKINIKIMMQLFIFMFYIIFISKGRMALFGLVLGLLLSLLFTQEFFKLKNLKKIFLIATFIVCLSPIFFSQISDLIDLSVTEIGGGSGNYAARLAEYDFYTEQVDFGLLGRGVISPKTGDELLDTKYGYFSISDIGVVGMYVMYGWIGILWCIFIVCVFFKTGSKTKNKLIYFAYGFYLVFTSLTLNNFYYAGSTLMIMLLFMYMDLNSSKLLKN